MGILEVLVFAVVHLNFVDLQSWLINFFVLYLYFLCWLQRFLASIINFFWAAWSVFLIFILEERYLFEWIYINVGELHTYEVVGKAEQAMTTLLSMVYEHSIFVSHAVKFDVHFLPSFFRRFQMNRLDCDREVEVHYFKGSEEDVTNQVAGELLPDCEIDDFFLVVPFDGDSLFLWKLHWFLPAKLKKNGLVSSNKLRNNVFIQITIMERKKKGPWNWGCQAFNINTEEFLHFEADIAGEVVCYSLLFFLLKDDVCSECWLLLEMWKLVHHFVLTLNL